MPGFFARSAILIHTRALCIYGSTDRINCPPSNVYIKRDRTFSHERFKVRFSDPRTPPANFAFRHERRASASRCLDVSLRCPLIKTFLRKTGFVLLFFLVLSFSRHATRSLSSLLCFRLRLPPEAIREPNNVQFVPIRPDNSCTRIGEISGRNARRECSLSGLTWIRAIQS